jgi:hypothetical protein
MLTLQRVYYQRQSHLSRDGTGQTPTTESSILSIHWLDPNSRVPCPVPTLAKPQQQSYLPREDTGQTPKKEYPIPQQHCPIPLGSLIPCLHWPAPTKESLSRDNSHPTPPPPPKTLLASNVVIYHYSVLCCLSGPIKECYS